MAGADGIAPGRKILLILILFFSVAAVVALIVRSVTKKETLRGLLVDLELRGPDSTRYRVLREALVRRLPQQMPELRNIEVTLQYVHFSEVTEKALRSHEIDFILLSPQGTPWYMYRGDAGRSLAELGACLKDLILRHEKPVLGICGGHQFLALAFGGTVDLIDTRYAGRFPERYPEEATAEKGPVDLQTLRSDPILKGVVHHPGTFPVVESHYDEVKKVPAPFVNIARSNTSEVQLMRIPNKIVYGMAFHPERGWDSGAQGQEQQSAGQHILANFLTMVRDSRRSGTMFR